MYVPCDHGMAHHGVADRAVADKGQGVVLQFLDSRGRDQRSFTVNKTLRSYVIVHRALEQFQQSKMDMRSQSDVQHF